MAHDVEKQPAEFALRTARRHIRRMDILVASAGVLMALVFFAVFGLGSSVLAWLGVVVMYAVSRQLRVHEALARRWGAGSNAERAVGAMLNALRAEGYDVMHDIEPEKRGNIDHLVCGPTGVFLIETKTRAYLDRHLPKAKAQAAQLGGALGVWVTPVICLHERRSKPFCHHNVWIVPHDHLLEWIRRQRNATVDSQRLAAFAASCS